MTDIKLYFLHGTRDLPVDIQHKIWKMYIESLMSPKLKGHIARWNRRKKN